MFNITVDRPKFDVGTVKSTRSQIGGPSLDGNEFGRSSPIGMMHFGAIRGELDKAAGLRISGAINVSIEQGHAVVTGEVGVGSDEEAGRLKEIGDRIVDHARAVALFIQPGHSCALSATYITVMRDAA